LKQRLIDTWTNISQNVIDTAVDQWRKRLRASMKAKGHHFEHFLTETDSFQSQHTTTTGCFQSHQHTEEREKHVVSRHFNSSYLKASKVSKSEKDKES